MVSLNAEQIKPLAMLDDEALGRYYELSGDPDAAASTLAEALQLPEYQHDARSAIRLDYVSYVLQFAKDVNFGPLRTQALLGVALNLLHVTAGGVSCSDAQATFKRDLLQITSPKPGPDSGLMSPDQVAQVGQFFGRTFFRHFRLYVHVFSSEQELSECEAALLVETAVVQPFAAAQSEGEWHADAEAARQAAEAAARCAEEERAAAVAAAAREAAEREAAEAEARRREELAKKPATLEEAIKVMVAVRLEEEKKVLSAEYASKEEALVKRISDLETGQAQAPAKKK